MLGGLFIHYSWILTSVYFGVGLFLDVNVSVFWDCCFRGFYQTHKRFRRTLFISVLLNPLCVSILFCSKSHSCFRFFFDFTVSEF